MVKERVIEGGAIEDDNFMSMEEYSAIMKKKLGREYMEFVNYVLDHYEIPENVKILEVGPGPGWIGIFLMQKITKSANLIGLEPSKDMRRVAKKNAKETLVDSKIEYIEGYVESLDRFDDDEFDLVISNESLHHWVDPAQGFKEINRVLKKNGKLYISDGRRDLTLLGKIIVHIFGPIFAGKMVKYWKSSINASYTPYEIKRMLEEVKINDWKVNSNILELSICNF